MKKAIEFNLKNEQNKGHYETEKHFLRPIIQPENSRQIGQPLLNPATARNLYPRTVRRISHQQCRVPHRFKTSPNRNQKARPRPQTLDESCFEPIAETKTKVFLDANILVSAARNPHAGLHEFWKMRNLALCTSTYATDEARANLNAKKQHQHLERLLLKLKTHSEPKLPFPLPPIDLPEKDKAIFYAALEMGAEYLITGDRQHFGKYFGKTIHGLQIMLPAKFLKK